MGDLLTRTCSESCRTEQGEQHVNLLKILEFVWCHEALTRAGRVDHDDMGRSRGQGRRTGSSAENSWLVTSRDEVENPPEVRGVVYHLGENDYSYVFVVLVMIHICY